MSNKITAALIQQASLDFAPALRAMVPWHYKYCERHGIIYQPSFGAIDEKRHPHWDRFPLLLATLKAGYADIVIWLDADCVIARGDVSLVEAADEFLLLGAVLHPETWRTQPFHFNMGAMYIRNSPRTIAYLEAVMALGRIDGAKWENQDTLYVVAQTMNFPICRIRNRWNSDPRQNDCLNPVVRGFHGTGVAHLAEMEQIAGALLSQP